MSLVRTTDRLELPETLQNQLYDFRKLVWTIKMIEAVCGAAAGVLVAFLALFVLDRLGETPGWARLSLSGLTVVSCACVPLALHRWVWRNRRLEQLARLLTRKHPLVGDQLLGIIELVRNDFEQARSPQLCVAAIRQVAEDAQKRDFCDSVPNPRHRLWVALALIPLAATNSTTPALSRTTAQQRTSYDRAPPPAAGAAPLQPAVPPAPPSPAPAPQPTSHGAVRFSSVFGSRRR